MGEWVNVMSARIGEGQLIIIRQQQSINSSMSRKDRSRALSSSPKVDAARANRYCWIHYLRGVCVQSKQAAVVLSGVGERRQRVCRLRLTVSSCPQNHSLYTSPHGIMWPAMNSIEQQRNEKLVVCFMKTCVLTH
jgi:hypothetical protein